MITNNLKENKNVNFSFHTKLTSKNLNSFLNSSDKVAVNLSKVLSNYYYSNKISSVNINLSDKEVQEFLNNSINNFILKTLLDASLTNNFNTELNDYNINFNYKELSFNGSNVIEEVKNKTLFRFSDDTFKKDSNNTYGHIPPKNNLYPVGLYSNKSGWNVDITIPALNTINNYGHISDKTNNYNVKIPNPSSSELLFEGSVDKNSTALITSNSYSYQSFMVCLLIGGENTYRCYILEETWIQTNRANICVAHYRIGVAGNYYQYIKFYIPKNVPHLYVDNFADSASYSRSIYMTVYGIKK